jgi:hypothetical protein
MPTNRPTGSELLDAVQGFLKAEVLSQLSGSVKYHLQVAINALGILGRELHSGARFDSEEHERLRSLMDMSGMREDLNRLLCARIRERAMSYADRPLIEHLMQSSMAKMSIDNPKYATYVRELQARGGEAAGAAGQE